MKAACPTCSETFSESTARPFCSDRCRNADLGKWLNGSYRIPGDPVDPMTYAESSAAFADALSGGEEN